jgi:programmed cell death 8 (apoptosis-inducing factor)
LTSKKQIKDLIIIGGGFLGSEMACSLAKKGKNQGFNVTQVFPECGMMCLNFPRYLSEYTTEKMKKGNLITNNSKTLLQNSASTFFQAN